MSGHVIIQEVTNFEQWHPAVSVGYFTLHAVPRTLHTMHAQTGRLHIAAMNRKEMNAKEAGSLPTPSGQFFGTAGTHEYEFGLSTHPRHRQEACEVAEEDEMKDELFNCGIQVLNNACETVRPSVEGPGCHGDGGWGNG